MKLMNIKHSLLLLVIIIAGMNLPAMGQIVTSVKSEAQIADSIRAEIPRRPCGTSSSAPCRFMT